MFLVLKTPWAGSFDDIALGKLWIWKTAAFRSTNDALVLTSAWIELENLGLIAQYPWIVCQ